MRRLLLGTVLVLAGFSLLACSSDDAGEDGGDATPHTTATTQATSVVTTTATTEATATSTGAATSTSEATSTESAPTESAGGDEVRTEIARFAFETPIEISVGTSVTWTNTEEPHTVTARDGSFDSDRIPQGESFTHTFDEAGTFEYFCQIHPAMEGTVIVE
jgi:plastocyanin